MAGLSNKTVSCVCLFLAAIAGCTFAFDPDPEENMTFCQIAENNHYSCEEYLHQVQTADGFLLTLHRITGRTNEPSGRRPDGWRLPAQLPPRRQQRRPAVFVQHGLLCDSTSWILNLPKDSLPFVLADAGFDVWLGNSRGNTYSRKHVQLDPADSKFWAWSWDEMALYDLPASIDFVLNATGQSHLYYVGHSQGTLIAFTHLSLTQSTKIKYMVALGPVFSVKNMTCPLRLLAPYSFEMDLLFHLFGVKDFLPSDWLIRYAADHFCSNKEFARICADILFVIAGADTQQFNDSRIPLYIAHTPAGTSVQNMIHFAQMVESGMTGRFDYGAIGNELHYGQVTPPRYFLNVSTPVSLFWAEKDVLADPQDVHFLAKNLENVKDFVEIPAWDHLDFIWAMDATAVLYSTVVSRLNEAVAAEQSRH